MRGSSRLGKVPSPPWVRFLPQAQPLPRSDMSTWSYLDMHSSPSVRGIKSSCSTSCQRLLLLRKVTARGLTEGYVFFAHWIRRSSCARRPMEDLMRRHLDFDCCTQSRGDVLSRMAGEMSEAHFTQRICFYYVNQLDTVDKRHLEQGPPRGNRETDIHVPVHRYRTHQSARPSQSIVMNGCR